MPRNILFEVSPYNPGTSATVTVRMSRSFQNAPSGVDVSSGVLLNSLEWKPVITDGPARSITIFSNGAPQPIDLSHGTISFRVDPRLANEVWSTYSWDGAYARVYVGDLGSPFSSYTQIFEGLCGPLERDAQTCRVSLLGPEAALNATNLLTATYAGTGGAEGDAKMIGVPKPVAYGACSNVAPVLVDAASWIYQVNNGAVNDIPMVYENAYQVNATAASNAASFTALKALSLVPGQWAKCTSGGYFRLGGQPNGLITADVQGALDGATYVSTIATIVPAMLKVAGVNTANIDTTTLSTATGTTAWCFYATDQITVGDAVRAAYDGFGFLFPGSTGVWKASNWTTANASTTALNADRSATPLVRSIKQIVASAPNYRVRIGADRAWHVNGASEISSAIYDAGAAASAANTAATNAQNTANTGAANATTALTRLASIAADNVLDRVDKVWTTAEFSRLTAEKSGIDSQATGLGITTELTAYDAAYSALNTYMSGLSPAYTDTTSDTNITRTTWDSNWNGLYSARTALLNKIAAVAATMATWASVTGAGRPEDFATSGLNLLVNASLSNSTSGFTLTGSAVRNAASAGDPAPYFVRFANASGTITSATYIIPANSSGNLYVGWKQRQSANNGFTTQQIAFLKTDGTSAGSAPIAAANPSFSTASTAWVDVGGTVAIPTGAASFYLWITPQPNSGATFDVALPYVQAAQPGATTNNVTYSSSAPASPQNGDVWVDTSATPNVTKVRVSGAWQIGANLVTGTGQISDTANLGGTAVWTGVTGTGKPADNSGTTLQFVTNGSGTATINGNNIIRTDSLGTWTQAQFSKEFFVGTAYVSGKLGTASTFLGLADTNTIAGGNVSQAYYELDYSFHCSTPTVWYCYESGTSTFLGASLNGVTFSSSTQFQITYDGVSIRYYADGVLMRTVATTADRKFYAGAALGVQSGAVNEVQFGPFSTNNFTNIGGSTKPADNATVGAILGPGGNVSGAVDGNLRPIIDFTAGHVSKSLANVDSAANTKLSGIAAGATVGATWGVDLGSRPAELTDGRVSTALDSTGRLQSRIVDGAILGTSGSETVSNTIGRTSKLTTGGKLSDYSAFFAGGIVGVRNTNSVTLSAADGGTSITLTIPSHTRKVPVSGGSTAITYNSGSITGLAYSTYYLVYCDDPNIVGGAVTYVATTDSDATLGTGRVLVGFITTPAAGGSSSGGGGGYTRGSTGGGVIP